MEEKKTPAALDFQPDAVALAMRPLPWWARCGVWLALVVFIGALVAAHFCRVDVIVTGRGRLVSSMPNIAMKPLETSVIQSVCVRVGQVVHQGDVLFTFDPEINAAEVERLTHECISLQAQFDRWNAEFEETPMPKYENPTSDQAWQLALYRQRQSYYEEKLQAYDSNLQGQDAAIATKQDSIRMQRQRYEKLMQIYTMYDNLQKENLVALKDLLQVEMECLQLESEIIGLENSVVEDQHDRETMVAGRQSFVMEWKQEISQNLVAVRRELLSTQAQLEKAKRRLQYDCLRAPCDAVVHEIASFPVGSAVREAEELIMLVPVNCDIELEAEIPAKDIGRIQLSDPVRVKLNAFPFQQHGTLDGTIRVISEDAFHRNTTQQNPTLQEGDGAFYRARILLNGQLRMVPEDFRLIPGMEAQVEIKTGTRSVLEYILHPLTKALDEAAREP